jgi:putative peptide zinc metalloprotease protein
MQDAMLSPQWYRIAGLHPRLRPHVSVRMQTTRGQAWYVLYNHATGRHHRVNAQAYQLVGRLDGRLTVDQVWQMLLNLQGDRAPSQHDVIRILGQMTDAGLIQAEVTPDVRQHIHAHEQAQQRQARAQLNPMSFRMGLFDPSALLERIRPLGRLMWSRWAQLLWLVVVLGALGAVLAQWQAVQAYGRIHFMSPGYLALAWLIYPVMKGLHELGHALTLRRYNCEVPEVGVNFFLFVPLPYVDASASNRLASRWQRGRISVAGIAVEMFLAGLGAWLWLTVEEGWVRQVAFVVMSIGGLSSLLINGNPLMKLDGYYVMIDALDLPNLAPRSAQQWQQRWRRLLIRAMGLQAPPEAQAVAASDLLERMALQVYAPLAWAYRGVVSALIVGWAADQAAALGLLVAGWAVWSLLVKPSQSLLASIRTLPSYAATQGRVRAMLVSGTVVLLALVVFLPLPSTRVVEGVVWLPEEAQVRAQVDGRIDSLKVRPDQAVRQGAPLLHMVSEALETERAALLLQIDRGENEFNAAFLSDPLKMGNAREALERDRAALARIEDDLARLVVRASRDGTFAVARAEDLEGRDVRQGDLLAYVFRPTDAVVRAVVPQADVEEVRRRLRRIDVMLDEQPGRVFPARMYREVPMASDALPAPAMADRKGGRVPTDPKDPEGQRPMLPGHVVDIELIQPLPRAGGLARVRLELKAESLANSVLRHVRQLMLRHFASVQT